MKLCASDILLQDHPGEAWGGCNVCLARNVRLRCGCSLHVPFLLAAHPSFCSDYKLIESFHPLIYLLLFVLHYAGLFA